MASKLEYTPTNPRITDNSPVINMLTEIDKFHVDGNPLDERSGLDKMRESNLMTDSMSRRNALYRKSIAAAAKVGRGYRDFETPNQPENQNSAFTDGFGYC